MFETVKLDKNVNSINELKEAFLFLNSFQYK